MGGENEGGSLSEANEAVRAGEVLKPVVPECAGAALLTGTPVMHAPLVSAISGKSYCSDSQV